MAEPQDIETSLKIPSALKIHKVSRTYNENNACRIESHIQWYRKVGEPDVCGRKQLPLSYKTDQMYSYCKERYKGNEWLECKLSDQWFHEACFEK